MELVDDKIKLCASDFKSVNKWAKTIIRYVNNGIRVTQRDETLFVKYIETIATKAYKKGLEDVRKND